MSTIRSLKENKALQSEYFQERHVWVISLKAVFCDNQGRFLCLHKASKDKKWELPGGGLDGLESPEKCLVRELKEEIGWTNIKITDTLISGPGVADNRFPDIYYILFQAQADQQKIILSKEHDDYAWFSKEDIRKELEKENFNPALAEFLFNL